MRSFINRCWQVWLGWIYWPIFRVLIWIMCAQWAAVWLEMQLEIHRFQVVEWQWWIGVFITPVDFIDHIIPALLVPAVPMMIVWRLKTDLGDWRRAVMPGYRAPHLLVAALIAAAIFLFMAICPTLLDLSTTYANVHDYGYWYRVQADGSHHALTLVDYFWLDRYSPGYNDLFLRQYFWPPLGELAWLTFAMIAIGWLTAFLSVLSGLGIAVVALGLLQILGVVAGTTYVWHFWRINFQYEFNRDPVLITCVFVLDAGLLLLLWLRLARQPVGRDSVRADERVPWLSRLLSGVKPPLPGTLMQAGIWQRARHRRRLGRRFVWLVAAFTAVMIIASPVTYHTVQWLTHGDFAFSVLIAAGIISALCVGLSWPQRFAELNEIELLRPAPRGDCAREIGLAMLIDAVELSVATTLAMFVPIAFWSPNMLETSALWTAVAAGILAQALTFGLLVWTMLLRSQAATMLALFCSIMVVTMLLYYAMQTWLTPALVAGGIGVLLAGNAYRRWLRADML
jgi:hypothetical protein